jgi:hypothetical protein
MVIQSLPYLNREISVSATTNSRDKTASTAPTSYQKGSWICGTTSAHGKLGADRFRPPGRAFRYITNH